MGVIQTYLYSLNALHITITLRSTTYTASGDARRQVTKLGSNEKGEGEEVLIVHLFCMLDMSVIQIMSTKI